MTLLELTARTVVMIVQNNSKCWNNGMIVEERDRNEHAFGMEDVDVLLFSVVFISRGFVLRSD
jgi:hypothetical protein